MNCVMFWFFGFVVILIGCVGDLDFGTLMVCVFDNLFDSLDIVIDVSGIIIVFDSGEGECSCTVSVEDESGEIYIVGLSIQDEDGMDMMFGFFFFEGDDIDFLY